MIEWTYRELKSNIWENINEKFKYAHMIFIDENEASDVINKIKT